MGPSKVPPVALGVIALSILVWTMAARLGVPGSSVDGELPAGSALEATAAPAVLVAPLAAADALAPDAAPLPVPPELEGRSAAAEPAPPTASSPAGAADVAVAGVVVDADGRPVVGARLWLAQTIGAATPEDAGPGNWAPRVGPSAPPPSVGPGGAVPDGMIFISSTSLSSSGPRNAEFRPVTTDATGAFLVERSRTADGGRLTVTAPNLLDHRHVHDVDRSATHQVVRLPPPIPAAGEWTVELIDGEGQPVRIRTARVMFVGRTVPGPLPPARQDALLLQGQRAVQRDLAPGQWRIELIPERGLPLSTTWSFRTFDERRTERLKVTTFPNGTFTQLEAPRLPPGELPWIDATSGFAAWLPEERDALGQAQGDRYFAMTLQTAQGEVLGATLRLHLRAVHVMSENDSLMLDFTGNGAFAWHARISDLTGGDWSPGREAQVLLDLARLPLKEGATFDGRSLLADGFLDVAVQDDSAVLAITLDVVHARTPR